MPMKLDVARPDDFVEFRKESILQGIHQRIEDQVLLYPGNVALKTREVVLTYAEMNGHANSIAAEMLSASGTKLDQAAILLSNTPDCIITILASLKAHKAYVPLDPGFPKQRLQAMVEDTEPAVLLTDDQHMQLAEELAGKGVPIINISGTARHTEAPNPQVPCDPLDRAYILFTSGSTGRPKGITFLHRNLLHHTMGLTDRLFFAPSDRVTWLHSASFAASIVDVYCCLTNGGALYPWDVKTQGFTGMAEWFAQQQVRTLQWIPSAFRHFLRTVPDDFVFQSIRMVIMASEPLTIREVELFRRHFPAGCYLVNQVGTSEAGNYRLYVIDHDIPLENANVPAGYATSEDRSVCILDDEHRQLPPGSVGEIGVQTDYMAAGYWRDEALTRRKFLLIDATAVPVFLTGDLGRLEPDGCLTHLGRKDFQVKIRGYRVELAEIEHALTAAPGVADAVVSLVQNRRGEDQLVGYVILKEPSQLNQQAVETHLELRLPDYMVPRNYVVLDRFPTQPTGKVDRTGLPNPFERTDWRVPPAHSILPLEEMAIVEMFEELLQVDSIDLDTSFLKAGGDSLLTAVLLSRVHKRFDVEVSIGDFLESPTPSHLAALVRMAAETGGRSPSVGQARREKRGSSSAARTESQIKPACAVPGSRLVKGAAYACTVDAATAPFAKKNLVIICAGGLGREVFTWAATAIAAGAPWRIKGFLDKRADALERYNYECRVIGDVDCYQIEEDDVFIGAIGNPKDKMKCYSPIIEKKGQFINLIHPLAYVGENVQLGTGVVLAPFASLTSDISVGNHVSIGSFSNAGHDTVIGDWCQISSFCGINGNAVLGEGTFLGSHVCIIPGTRVGAWAFAGAGSVVVRDVPPRVKVFGNPATQIGKVEAA